MFCFFFTRKTSLNQRAIEAIQINPGKIKFCKKYLRRIWLNVLGQLSRYYISLPLLRISNIRISNLNFSKCQFQKFYFLEYAKFQFQSLKIIFATLLRLTQYTKKLCFLFHFLVALSLVSYAWRRQHLHKNMVGRNEGKKTKGMKSFYYVYHIEDTFPSST